MPRKKKVVAPVYDTDEILPFADIWIEGELNVLLISEHGAGKTMTVEEIARRHKLKLHYLSCSTLDPYTDLCGVPVPVEDETSGRRVLEMVAPIALEEADFIFFDELNRGHPQVLNALFEIIQFRRINGRPIKAKHVWAAINPPNQDYNVDDMDRALVDRFDIFKEIEPTISIPYLATKYGDDVVPLAQAASDWWTKHRTAVPTEGKDQGNVYVSPRRIDKIVGEVYRTKSTACIIDMFPPGMNVGTTELIEEMGEKLGEISSDMRSQLAAAKELSITYDAEWFSENADVVAAVLDNEYCSLETVEKSVEVLNTVYNPKMIFGPYVSIYEALARQHGARTETMCSSWSDGKIVFYYRAAQENGENIVDDLEALCPTFRAILQDHPVLNEILAEAERIEKEEGI